MLARGGLIGAAGASSAVTYVYEQDFDGAGTPSGWTSAGTVGAVDYDYATSPAPLFGTQSMSLYIPSTGYRNAIYASFADQSGVYVAFMFRNETLSVGGNKFFELRDSSNAILVQLRVTSGVLYLRDGAANSANLGAWSLDATRTMMIRYQKGTGANAALTAWELVAGSWSQIGTLTTGTGTTDASRLFFEVNAAAAARLIVDRIIVSVSQIPASTYA